MYVIIGLKPAPGDHQSNLKKMGSILCGFNTMGYGVKKQTYRLYFISDNFKMEKN